MDVAVVPELDLEAYFRRIGYSGSAHATLETLRHLHALHPAAIPFENLAPFAGLPVPLDLGALERKLVFERRGGYCFEQNLFFMAVLQALGFAVSGLAAHVLWNTSSSATPDRSHMLLRVDLDASTYLVDVGFGGQTATAPLRLDLDGPQWTPHERFRVIPDPGDAWTVQAEVRSTWKPLYRLDLAEMSKRDYEVTNHHLSTHPRSPFRTAFMVARPFEGGRYALSGTRFAEHRQGAKTAVHRMRGPDELRQILAAHFDLEFPRVPEIEAALGRIFEPSRR